MTALSIMGLLPESATVERGRALLNGTDLFAIASSEMEEVRGARIGMVFQDPMAYLNPLMPIGEQLGEGLRRHRDVNRSAAKAEAVEMLRLVGLPRQRQLMEEYPHRLSGGMRQRVLLAIALICRPSLLIADEPTTALDVTLQAQIITLINDLRATLGTAV